jgi:hypothetical protein
MVNDTCDMLNISLLSFCHMLACGGRGKHGCSVGAAARATDIVPCLHQAIEQKQLQKEAAQRLNQMIDELRNSQNADLSAKNLGEEGCQYISDGLAFNERSADCTARAAAAFGSVAERCCKALVITWDAWTSVAPISCYSHIEALMPSRICPLFGSGSDWG